jgi:UDP-2,3-diacylglucosamine hydrolase
MRTVRNEQAYSLFISDLHLCQSRPFIQSQFLAFLKVTARTAHSLFILGDLFEYWAGDDDLSDPFNSCVIAALRELSNAGVALFLIHGNRDFLLSDAFMQATGAQCLDDPCVLELYGRRVLLGHGDIWCTDDVAYQAFRHQVRDLAWQTQFLSQPLAARKAQIEGLRLRSESEKSQKSMATMDVNLQAIEALFRDFDYPILMIHGHTHRPAKHLLQVDGHACERWVLGDWYEQGSCLRLDASGCSQAKL